MSQPQICLYYSRTGTCKFGTDCRYRHVLGGASETAAPTQVCQHYSRTGNCRFGTGCRYRHVDAGVEAVTEPAPPPPKPLLPPSSHLSEFFSLYPLFKPSPCSPILPESHRLCSETYHWGRENPEKEKARALFKYAMVYEFNGVYGTDVDDPASWSKVCQVLELPAVPGSSDACRRAVEAVFVNIVDLIDATRTGQKVRVFQTAEELLQYTKETGKVFSLNGYAGGLLKYLYRKVFGEPRGLRPVPRKERREKERAVKEREGKESGRKEVMRVKESAPTKDEDSESESLKKKKESRFMKTESLKKRAQLLNQLETRDKPRTSSSKKRPEQDQTPKMRIMGLSGGKRAENEKRSEKENQKVRDLVKENIRSEMGGKGSSGKGKRGEKGWFDAKAGVRDFVVKGERLAYEWEEEE
ncbi:hypothetical protein JAAARDRAFT_197541 [Jaapia argillacea MUCL 33604]|uniref:C3H1-type domain-containing protein n=1 Tax=Jaapia argillacea MUCL 33604 TaxID=933084 RepID=A0A067PSU2_9AGAM|nr:hypothetical protein JAAARDRAFT_197541 [Jaapia argillacea MUCL 33604]